MECLSGHGLEQRTDVDDRLGELKACALGRLTIRFAHELRNMLTGIRCYLELLSEAALPDGMRGYLREVDSSLERLTESTASWLEVARASAATPYVNGEVFRVTKLLRLAGVKVPIECELARDIGLAAIAGDRLQAALFVLLFDLVSDSPERVQVTTRRAGDQIAITMRASGGTSTDRDVARASEVAKSLGVSVTTVNDAGRAFDLRVPEKATE